MTARQNSAQEAHAAKPALKRSAKENLSLHREVLQNLPLGVIVLQLENPQDASSFRIIDLNPVAASLIGSTFEDLRGRTLADFPHLLETSLPRQCLRVFRSRKARSLGEISYGDERIRPGVYALRVFPLPDSWLGVAFENVADRKPEKRGLRENQERFRLLIERVQEYAIFEMDPLGHVVSWNAGAQRLKGYRADEILGKHFSVFYLPEDVVGGKPERNLGQAASRGRSEDEGWRVRKDGSRFWAHAVITALRDPAGVLHGFIKVTQDMTEPRQREEALTKANQLLDLRVKQRAATLIKVNQDLRVEVAERERAEERLRISLEQMRALAARLQRVREEERTLVAREIHDELGQACTAIKMDLASIGRKATKRQTKLLAKVHSASKLVDDMIVMLRRIASELRPQALDHLGLTAALEWQAQEFESRTAIRCTVILPEEQIALDTERSTAIFRIFQETLTNVARHAHATRVEARLEKEGDQLLFQVHDNGKGFDPEEAKARKSLGLIGMQERALILNGRLTIEGVPGAGTTMTLRIPLPRQSLTRSAS
jgi:PAS domain S-box-containing protein